MSIDPESGATIPDGASSPFPNPGETAQDYDAQAQAEVIAQYRESPKLRQTISDLMAGWQAIEDCMVGINRQIDPAIAQGVNLDVIGERVGQSRVIQTADGTHSLAIVDGGSYVIGAHTFTGLALYRLLITWRIARNKAIGSSPQYMAALEAFVFVDQAFRYIDLGGMATVIELATGAPPNADTLALLDNGPLPRAMAVGVGRDWYDPADVFGFEEDPDAIGFGEIGDPTFGGGMAELF